MNDYVSNPATVQYREGWLIAQQNYAQYLAEHYPVARKAKRMRGKK